MEWAEKMTKKNQWLTYSVFVLIAAMAIGAAIQHVSPASASFDPTQGSSILQGGSGSISGYVFENDGSTPIENAQVYIDNFDTYEGMGNAVTDATGYYQLGGLPSGSYRARAMAAGFANELYFEVSPIGDYQNADRIEVTEPDDTPDINFTLDPGGTISGTVYADDGITELEGVPVDTEWGGYGTCTDVNGQYLLEGVPLDTPVVVVAGGGWGDCSGDGLYIREYYDEAPYPNSATLVTLTAGGGEDATGINFTLDVAGGISGYVYEDDGVTAVEGAWISVDVFDTFNQMGGSNTDATGYYEIGGLPSNDYRVRAQADGFARELYDNVSYYSNHMTATRVTVTAGSTETGIDFLLDPGGTITGTVFASDGVTELAGIPVDTEPGGYGTCTDSNGQYTIDGLPLDTGITLYAGGSGWGSCSSDGVYTREYYSEASDYSSATPVTLTSGGGEHATGIDFTLDVGGSITGTVFASDGVTELAGVPVDTEPGGHGTCTDSNGQYTIDGLPLDTGITLYAGGSGWGSCSSDGMYMREYYSEAPDFSSATPVTLTSGGGEHATGIDFTLDIGGSITGTVYAEDGITGLEGVPVSSPDAGSGVCTDSNGEYTLYGLPLDTPIRVQAGGLNYDQCNNDGVYVREYWEETIDRDNATPITLTPGGGEHATGIDFTLQIGGTISFTVVGPDGVSPLEGVPVDTYPAQYFDCTRAGGVFTMEALPLDTPIVIYAGGPGWWGCTDQGWMREYWEDTPDVASATPIILTSGTPDVSGLEFVLTEPAGTISGTVYDTDGVSPVPVFTSICVQEYDTGQQMFCQAVGSFDAAYRFGGLPTGVYRVSANPSGGYAQNFYNNHGPDGNAADPVAVTAGSDAGGIDFTMQPAGMISGTVYADDGVTTLTNVGVGVEDLWIGTCVDENGQYTLYGVPVGTPVKVVGGWSCDGPRQYFDEWWNEAPDSDSATPITLTTQGESVTGIDFTLEPSGSISGTVVEQATGFPIANAQVCAEGGGDCTSTAPDGTYTMGGLVSGNYQVRAQADGWAMEFYLEVVDPGLSSPVVVTAGSDTPGIDFTLEPGGSISGTVTDQGTGQPLANMLVVGNQPWVGTCTNADGTYTIPSIPFGMEIRVSSGASCDGPTVYLEEYYNEKPDWDSADVIILDSGTPDITGINLTLEVGGSISGTMYDTDGVSTLSSGDVCVNDFGTNNHLGCTGINPDGTYLFNGLASGTYRVTANAPDYATNFYDNHGPDGNAADPVSVTVGSDTGGIDFVMQPGGTISGTVYASDGVTTLTNVGVGVMDLWLGTCVDENGQYTLYGVPVGTPVKVLSGWACDGPMIYLAEWWNNVPDPDSATPITLATQGENVPGIDFTLDLGGSISGTMYDTDGVSTLSSGEVCINEYDTNDHVGCAGVNPDGTYTYAGLTSGTYRVTASAPDYAINFYDNHGPDGDAADPVGVTVGSDTGGIDFVMQPGGTISGTVYASDGVTTLTNVGVGLAGVWLGNCVDENGQYTLYGVPVGTPVKVVGGWSCDGPRQYFDEWWNEAPDSDSATPITLTTQGESVTGIDFTLEPSGSISGTVVEQATGFPIANAQVCAEGGGDCTSTAPDGTYTMGGLVSGNYQVRAQADGWAMEFYLEVVDPGLSSPVVVTAGSDTPGIDFTLEPGGSISGTVTDQGTGQPLANMLVVGNQPWVGTCTNADGTYTIPSIPFGMEIRVSSGASCDGPTVYLEEYYNEKPDWDNADVIILDSGTPDITGINLTLEVGGSISGTMYDTDGVSTLSSGDVCVEAYLDGGNFFGCVSIEPDGTYTFGGLPTGTYSARAHAPDRADAYYNNQPPNGEVADPINVTAGSDTGGIDFVMQPGGTISGTVFAPDGVTPLANISVGVADYWLGACTDQNGEYTIYGVPLNVPHRINAGSPCNEFPDMYLMQWWDHAPNYDSATPITLTTEGEAVLGIDFTLELGGRILGTVFDTDGVSTLSTGSVCVEDFYNGDGYGCVGLEPDGTYTIWRLPTGTYRVRANAPDYAESYYDNQPPNGNLADPVAVTAGADTWGIDFVMQPGGTISGTVYAADGVTALPNVSVGLSDLWLGACTDQNGEYTIYGVPLNTPHRVSAGRACDGPDTYLEEWWNEAPNYDSATPIELTTPGEAATGIDFTLEEGATISGYVYESDGVTTIAGAWVSIDEFDTFQGWGGTDTGPDGSYMLTGLAPGEYRLRAGADGYANELYDNVPYYSDHMTATRVTIANPGDDLTGYNFTLDPGGTISGTVLADDGVTPLAGVPVDTEPGGFGRCTDENGDYLLDGLPLDTPIMLYAGGQAWGGCSNDGTYVREYWPDAPNYDSATPVTLTSGGGEHATGIDFMLNEGGSVSGTVLADDGVTPLVDMGVSVHFDGWGMGTCTDANGDYTVDGLPLDVDFRVSAGGNGHGCPGSYDYIQEFWQETPDWNSATLLQATSTTPDIGGINFTLDLGGSVSGTVYAADGVTTLANMNVDAQHWDTGNGFGAQTDSNGHFVITGLPGGDYKVNARGSGYAIEFYNEAGPYDWNADPVSVTSGADTPGIDFTLDPGGTVSGTVYDTDGVTPLANMPVSASSLWLGTCTDGDGNYIIESVPLNLAIEYFSGGMMNWCGGPTTYEQQWWNHVPDYDSATSLTLTPGGGETMSGINFTLRQGGTISGTVFEVDGVTPISDITVRIEDYDWWAWTCTDANGDFSLGTMPLDVPLVVTAATDNPMDCGNNSGYAQEWWQESSTKDGATPVTLSEASPTQGGIIFTLEAPGAISGRITDQTTGDGIPFADVWADVDGGGAHYETQADDQGYYVLEGLPTGGYHVWAYAPNYSEWGWRSTGSSPVFSEPVQVNAPNETTGIDIALAPGGSLQGRVTDTLGNPIPNIEVNVNFPGMDCTDADGYFSIDRLPVNIGYVLDAGGQRSGDSCGGPTGYALKYYNNVYDPTLATSVQLTTGGEVMTGLDFTLEIGGSLSGQIVDQGTLLGIPNADVTIDNQNGSTWDDIHVTADGSGNFFVEGLSPIEYLVFAEANGYTSEYYDGANGAYDSGDALPVLVPLGTPVPGIDIPLEAAGSISGTVYDADGITPLAFAEVNAHPLDWPVSSSFQKWTQSDSNGNYTINGLPPDVYRVRATQAGYVNEFYDEAGQNGENATPVAVTAGVNVPGIDFTLELGGTISGYVYAEDGITPLNNVFVAVEGMWLSACTNPDGSYVIGGMPRDVPFKVSAGGSGWFCGTPTAYEQEYWQETLFVDSATPITLTAATPDVGGIDFTLRQTGTIDGAVYDLSGAPLENMTVRADGLPQHACTDVNGDYMLEGVPFDMALTISSGGADNPCGGSTAYDQEWWEEAVSLAYATPVTVTEGAPNASGYDFTLAPTGTPLCAAVTEIPQAECEALVAIYSSTDGPNWTENGNWLGTNLPCGWFGVTCSAGHVTEVNFHSNGLNGTLPTQIDGLTELQVLDMWDNQLTGSIPSQIGLLTQLQTINLEQNQLSGPIPTEMGNLVNLQALWLWDNQLNGSLPASFQNLLELRYLGLHSNQLTGPIPSGLDALQYLIRIELMRNQLTGPIPPELGSLPNLEVLWLGGNQLAGPIPSQLGNLANLRTLDVSRNALEGEIPSSLTGLGNLGDGQESWGADHYADFGYNMLAATDPDLLIFLTEEDPDWADTQTVPPTGATASAVPPDSVEVSWTNILYTADGGYYEVGYSTTSGGPYTSGCTTADKTETTCTVSGLANGDYYFAVRTFTPAHAAGWIFQQNDLLSGFGEETTASVAGLQPDTNLVRNGDFAAGTSEWSVWGGASASVNAEVMELTNTGAGSLFQDAGVAAPDGAPFEMLVELGNSSAAAKDVQLLLHNPELTDVLSCQFSLPGGAGLNTYTMRGVTTMAWSDIRVEIVPLTYDGQPALLVDNIDVQYKPSLSLGGVECVVPEMPANLNVARNSDFADGEAQWNFYDMLGHSVTGGVLTFWDDDTSNGVWQDTYYGLPVGAPVTASVDLGNSSSANKEVMVVLHDHDWTGSMMCSFVVPAGAPLATYRLQGPTSDAWEQAMVAVWDLTGDGLEGIQMDNVDVQYQPSLSLSAVECTGAEMPANVNVARNGDFASDESHWNFFDMVGHAVTGGVLTFWDDDTNNGVWQNTFYRLPAGAPMNASVELGNSSAAAKEVMLVLHDEDWSESLMCYFALPAGAPLTTYTLQGPTTDAWDKAMVAVWDLTGNGLEGIQIDNIDVQYQPSLSLSGVVCEIPDAPDNLNLVRNGDFSNGESQWNAFDMLGHGVTGGVLTFWDDDTSNGMWQDTYYSLPAGAPMNASVELGNSSAANKEVMVVLHDQDWSGAMLCDFILPAGAPLTTYSLQGPTVDAWDRAMVAVWDLTGNGLEGIQLDNVDVQYQPSLSVTEVECSVSDAPADLNIVRNGDFSNGETSWSFFDMLSHSVTGGVLTFWDDDTSNGVWQNTFYSLPAGAPMHASVDLGNSSAAAKEVMVVLHDQDWSEAMMCNFILPAGVPLTTYILQGPTADIWDQAMVAVWDLTGNSLEGIQLDNVDVQYQPSLSLTGVECSVSDAPANLNLVRNSSFSNGETAWNFYDMVGHAVSGGVLTFWDDDTGNGVWQDTTFRLPASAPMNASVELGNSSSAGKEVMVVLHDYDWSDSLMCYFALPAGAPLATYTLQGPTADAWDNAMVAVWDLTGNGLEGIQMDNVDVQYQPSLSLSGLTCVVPEAPANLNLTRNGDFSNGESQWNAYDMLGHSVTGGVLTFWDDDTSNGMWQNTFFALPSGAPMNASVDLGNTSSAAKEVMIVLHDEDWSGSLMCYFALPAGTPLGTYTLQGPTAEAWDKAMVAVWDLTGDGLEGIQMDNVDVQYQPSLSLSGVTCDSPATGPGGADLSPAVEDPVTGPSPADTMVIEAETGVTLTGEWTAHATEFASGGAYVYSSGSAEDTLSLSFSGTYLAVMYVQHPVLGVFAVEVDGAVMQTVDSVADEAVFGTSVEITGLEAGEHVVRIVPVEGTMAIDAFVIETQPEPAVEPTPVPTEIAPAVTPTDEPAALETVESDDPRVTQTGEWAAHATELASGGAYVYSSGSVEDVLSLSFSGAHLAVTYVQHPVLGVFAVEVDGAVMQTVDSVADEAVFGETLDITGLGAGEHVVRIVPVEGTIAIDAFVVETQPEPAVEPTPVPTDTPTPEPSVDPTAEPTATPAETLDTIESDDARVAQTGLWTLTASELASGGAYLFSGGDVKDTLALAFTGPRLDVVYVKHPALGTFTIEVDGAVLYTVNSAGEAAFGAVVALNGLGDGAHTLRIAPVSGTIAIDAFVVEPQGEVPVVPTVDPTVEPTADPTVEPTMEPTVDPTEPVPTPTPQPTDVPPTTEPAPTQPPVATPSGPSRLGIGS